MVRTASLPIILHDQVYAISRTRQIDADRSAVNSAKSILQRVDRQLACDQDEGTTLSWNQKDSVSRHVSGNTARSTEDVYETVNNLGQQSGAWNRPSELDIVA